MDALKKVSLMLFRGVSLISGQFIPTPSMTEKLKVVCNCFTLFYPLLLTTVLGITVNTYPSAVILADWSTCHLNYFGVCYTIVLHSQGNQSDTTELPNIVLRDTDPGRNINDSDTTDNLENFEEFAKLALFFSAFSGCISYLIFVYILWCKYISQLFPWDRGTTKKAEELAEDGNQPAEDGNQLTEDGNQPAEDGNQPAEDDNQPAEDDNQLTEDGNQPAEDGNQLTEDGNQPAEDGEEQPFLPENQQQGSGGGSKKAVWPLHPFDDEESSDATTSTYLDGKESGWFLLFYIVNLLLVIGMVVVFCVGQYHHHPLLSNDRIDSSKTHKFLKWEISTVVTYSYSLICTISSCFVFSKVMYGIQMKCSKLEGVFLADPNNYNLERLIEKDKKFIKTAIETKSMFEFWFSVHWVMFIISSFLSLSLLIDAIDLKIKATLPNKDTAKEQGVDFYPWEMCFLTLFAASNSFFFLYPCIRAASVTEFRKKLIRKVNNNLKESARKTRFINYLKGQKFSFHLNILCARVAFDLNIAYISIFIGLLGVLIKIGTSL